MQRPEGSAAVRTIPGIDYHQLFESAMVGVSLTRADATYVTVNPAYAALFGYESPQRFLDEVPDAWALLPDPADHAHIVEVLTREDVLRGLEARMRRRDGEVRWVSIGIAKVKDARGEVVGYQSAIFDVTEARAAREREAARERALRESEARFRSLSSLTSDWIWETDAEHRFIHTPPRLTELIGYRAPHYVGKRRWEVTGLSPVEGDWSAHQQVLARRESFRDFEVVQVKDDGSHTFLQINGEPAYDEAGDFCGYRGTAKDVTARHDAEEGRARIARLYASLSAVTEAVAGARSAKQLLEDVCRIAVSSGDFQFALVRMLEPGTSLARLAAFAGDLQPGNLHRTIDIALGSPDAAESLTAMVLRRDAPVVLRGDEVTRRPILGPLARQNGAQAAAGYPIHRSGTCIGALVLNSSDPGAFDGANGVLLARMATNVAQGLERLEAADSLRRFRLAFDSSADLVGLVDRATMRFVDLNETLCRALGYTREELLAMSPDQVLPSSRAELEASYDLLIAEPARTLSVRSHYICRDGSHLPFEATRHAIRSGGRWVIVGVGRDIRERLAAEDALRRFRLALDHSGELIAIVDLETMRYVDVNDPLCAALGYTREELLAMHPDDLIPYSREELRATYTRLTEGGEVPPIRSHYKCKDGSILPYESHRHAVLSDGRWLIVSIARDIRAELVAEEALRRTNAYFRSLIENASDGVAATDMEWRYRYVSPALAALTGYPAEKTLGTRFGDLGVESAPAMRERIERALARGEGPQSVRFESRRADGALRQHEVVVSRGTGPDGEPIYVLVGRDVTERIEAQEALRRREEAFRAVAENAPDGIMRFDADLRCVFANAAIVKTAGAPLDAMLGRTLAEFELPGDIREAISCAVRRALASGDTQTIEFVFAGPRGERHYQARLAPENGPDGRPVSVLGISRDVTDRKRAERAMADSEARLRGIVEATAEPLLLVDLNGDTLFANPAASVLFGRPVAALEGASLGLPLADGRPADVDILLPDGGIRPAEMQFAPTRLDGREVLVVSLHDLSERKRFEEHIQHLATHDGLTGLPNRAVLGDRIEQAIVTAKRSTSTLALLFVDLDQFKLINDSFGHLAGDALLVEVAGRLSAAVREGDTVARLGGDEFVILLTNLSRAGDSAVVARKISEALEPPIVLESGELRATASIGISVYPEDGETLDALLQCADAAMYRAKDAGRNGYQFYSAEMGEQARARVETEAGLRRAIEREEFQLHFQPQVNLATGEVIGVEALLRWNHPQRGMVSPASFIPTAEESGLIVPIGEWALRAACREAAGWAAAGLGKVRVAVNLSARQFWRGSVTEAVRAALGESGLPPSQLEVEITESVVARDLKQVMLALEQLRRMGVQVAIDDFGTGYSSLAYLRSLPIQKLKIDRSFVKGIPSDTEATALVGEIVRLAHVLSLSVVAEGVETPEQAKYLREAGCEAMQGFLFARPMPAADFAALMRSGRKLHL